MLYKTNSILVSQISQPFINKCNRNDKTIKILHCSIRDNIFILDTDYIIGKSIDVKRAGAKGDGITDDTAAIRKAIFQALRLYKTTLGGWKGAIPIFLPHGKYLVTNSLITGADSELLFGRFYFVGAGSMNTEIIFQPPVEKYLFDNAQIFGFTTFKGLTFNINSAVGQKFMNFVGGGSSAAQALIFKDCIWNSYKNVITTTGNTMGSEVLFFGCRIFSAQTGDCVFEYSNSQSLNWRFFGSDIESVSNTIFRFKGGGGCINFYQGSLITATGGKVIHVPADGSETGYGDNNWPSINFWGCRYELFGTSMLVHIEHPTIQIKCSWYGCGMGMGSCLAGTIILKTMGMGSFNFDTCYGYGGLWKAEHTITGNEFLTNIGYNPVRVSFINNCPSWSEIISGSVTGNTDKITNGSEPIYNFMNCGPNKTVKPFNKNVYSGTYHTHLTTRITTDMTTSIAQLTGLTEGVAIDFEIPVPDGEISFITYFVIKPAWAGGYRYMSYDINIYNDVGKSQLIGSGILNTNNGIVIKLKEGEPLYFTGKMVVEFTAKAGNWGPVYWFEPHVIYIN